MVSKISYASFLLLLVILIVEISLVNCTTFKKCCESDEGLSVDNSTGVKYICSSEFKENVMPLMFRNINNVQFGIPQQCGTESCIDKTVDGEKIIELLCDSKEKTLTKNIPEINKCCPWNYTFNVYEQKCEISEDFNVNGIYDLESEAYNLIIRFSPECSNSYIVNNYLEYNDFTIYNGKLVLHYQDFSFPFEKETYCLDLKSENFKNKLFIRSCHKRKSSQIKKCCKLNESLITQNNTFVCNASDTSLKSRTSQDLSIGIPKLCGNETCIDKKTEDQTIVELFCDTKEKNSLVKLPTIYKCCPPNMFYDVSAKSCIEDYSSDEDLIFDSGAAMYNLLFGVPKCNEKMAYVDYSHDGNFVINNGNLTLNDTKIFENGTYCIDRRRTEQKIQIRACEYMIDACRDRPCVPKCCPPGQKLFKEKMKDKSNCVDDFSIPFYTNFTNSQNELVGIPANLAVLRNVECKRYVSTAFQLDVNGKLQFKDTRFPGINQRYCIEYYDAPNMKQYISLICFPTPVVGGLHNFYYLAGLIISIIFLAITLTIYFFLPELQNLHGRTVMSHSTSLLASYIFLVMVKRPRTSYNKHTCLILGYGIMYTFLVAFAWLNVMCFDIWYTFGVVKARGLKKHNDLKKFLLYSLYAYGVPLIITGITLYIDLFADVPQRFKPDLAIDACWFDLRSGRNYLPYTIFFAMPVLAIILFNIVLFALTVRHVLKVRGDIQRMQHSDSPKKRRFFTDKATLIMNFKLFIVMGISWIFEVVSMYVREPIWLWYLLDSINVLQGLWIFFIFVLKDNVWKALRKKLGYHVVREGSQTQSTVLSAKNSVASTMSLRVNGITKPEEKDLLYNATKNSAAATNGKSTTDSML